ncbi:MAG: autotransporter-associated beta strand repeat-containing protein [Verrucomicrobia bacterium]|nr:autotransporter-associated beta strand repeat-containing protein [Verrucomicrobiota bacterium]
MKPSVSLRVVRPGSLAALLASLLAAHAASAATTHLWDAGGSPVTAWSTDVINSPLNWSDDLMQTFAAGDTLDLSTLDITGDSVSTVDANQTLGIIHIGDATTSSNAWTLDNSDGAMLILDNSGSNAQINQLSTSFGDTISVPLQLNNNLTVTNHSAHALTLSGNLNAQGPSGSKTLTLDSPGTLILKGNNTSNPGSETGGGAITVKGGGTLKITAGLTNSQGTQSSNRGYGPMNVGTSTSGGNHLEVTGTGKGRTGSLIIGQGTSGSSDYGNNTVLISTPGASGSASYTTGTNSGNYYVGVYSPHNSLTVSGGAYITQNNDGGTMNSYVGQFTGADYNTMTITGANTRLSHGGQRLYIGGDGSHNSLLVEQGAQITSSLRILHIGGNSAASSFNSATVTNLNSGVTATQKLYIGLTANSTDNFLLVSDGGFFTGASNQANGAGCTIGTADGANNNKVTITGASSLFTFNASASNTLMTLACSTAGASVAADNNQFNVHSGATANLFIAVKLGGTNSKLNLGDGTGTSTVNLGTTAYIAPLVALLNLSEASAQLNFNSGKLVSRVGDKPLVTGPGTVHLNGPATFDTGTFTNSIASVISGPGSLTKEGDGTLTLASDTNTYSGNTNVNAGTLELTSANPNNQASAVSIVAAAGAKLNLNFSGDDVVGSLVIDGGTPMPDGIYGSSSSGAPFANQNDTAFAGTGTLSVVTPPPAPTYASWASDKGIPGALPNDDSDNDGVTNAVEMVLGGDPQSVMDVALLPQLALVTNPAGVPAGNYLEFTYRRTDLSVTAGLTATCEYGTDLVSPWTPAVDGAGGVVVLVDHDYASYGTATDRVRTYVPRGANVTFFGRLHVTLP